MSDLTEKTPASRRHFLRRSMTTAAVAVPAGLSMSSSRCLAGSPNRLTGLNATLINEILEDEMQHVPIIQNLLNDPDNPLPVPIRKPPKLNKKLLIQPNLMAFLETASVFENTGSGLYGGAS